MVKPHKHPIQQMLAPALQIFCKEPVSIQRMYRARQADWKPRSSAFCGQHKGLSISGAMPMSGRKLSAHSGSRGNLSSCCGTYAECKEGTQTQRYGNDQLCVKGRLVLLVLILLSVAFSVAEEGAIVFAHDRVEKQISRVFGLWDGIIADDEFLVLKLRKKTQVGVIQKQGSREGVTVSSSWSLRPLCHTIYR